MDEGHLIVTLVLIVTLIFTSGVRMVENSENYTKIKVCEAIHPGSKCEIGAVITGEQR